MVQPQLVQRPSLAAICFTTVILATVYPLILLPKQQAEGHVCLPVWCLMRVFFNNAGTSAAVKVVANTALLLSSKQQAGRHKSENLRPLSVVLYAYAVKVSKYHFSV